MQQIDEFKEGDTVWCAVYGQGEIAEIDPKLKYPVTVYFYDGKNVSHASYTLDGKLGLRGQRVLYFAPPKVEGRTTRPYKSELIGVRVVFTTAAGTTGFGMVTAEDPVSITIAGWGKINRIALRSVNKVTIDETNYV